MIRHKIFKKSQGICSDLVRETQEKSENFNIENHWSPWNVADDQISGIMALHGLSTALKLQHQLWKLKHNTFKSKNMSIIISHLSSWMPCWKQGVHHFSPDPSF